MIVKCVSAAVSKNGWCQPSAYSHHLGGWLTGPQGWLESGESDHLDLIFLEDFVKCQYLYMKLQFIVSIFVPEISLPVLKLT